MPKTAGPIVGISFTDDSIQAVAIRSLSPGTVEVTQVASIAIPAGAFDGIMIVDRGLLASAIREMLSKAHITAKNAVVGLPARSVFARTVTIPPVPESERRAVVRGEIDHLGILPPGQGTFDFVVFAKPATGGESGDSPEAPMLGGGAGKGDLALFFAAENRVAQAYWSVVTEAGLKVVGLEPSDYAAIRSVYPHLAARSLSLAISIGSNNTHLQFLRRGLPVYARRIDVGVQQMAVPDVAVMADADSGGWRVPSTPGMPGLGADTSGNGFDDKSTKANSSRQRLAQEIGRSIEYFGREYFADLTALTTVMLPNDLNLAGLPVYVTAALEQDVDFANAFESVQLPPELGDRLRQEEGVAYAPALGLALGPIGGKFAGLPVFNLSFEAIAATRFQQAPRVLTGAIAASAAVLAAGIAFALTYSHRDAPVRVSLADSQRALAKVTLEESTVANALSEQKKLVRDIQSRNLPWTNVLRHLSVAVPNGLGLTNVTAEGTKLTIAGVTSSPDWIPQFWSRMNGSAFFTDVTVPSITHDEDKIAFQMAASIPAPVAPNADVLPGATDSTDALANGVAATNATAKNVMAATR